MTPQNSVLIQIDLARALLAAHETFVAILESMPPEQCLKAKAPLEDLMKSLDAAIARLDPEGKPE